MRYNSNEVAYEFYKQLSISVTIYGVILIIVGGLIAWLGYDMNRRVDAIQSARRDILIHSSTAEERSLLKSQADQAALEIPFLTALLPLQDQLINFPREVGGLARQHGVEAGFAFGNSVQSTTSAPGTIAFTVSSKGTVFGLLDFIRSLETSRHLLTIDSLNLTSGDGKTYQSLINGKIFSQ